MVTTSEINIKVWGVVSNYGWPTSNNAELIMVLVLVLRLHFEQSSTVHCNAKIKLTILSKLFMIPSTELDLKMINK